MLEINNKQVPQKHFSENKIWPCQANFEETEICWPVTEIYWPELQTERWDLHIHVYQITKHRGPGL